jgi:hypothetical protein
MKMAISFFPQSPLYGLSSVLSRFDSFSICFSFSITSLGSMPFRTLATSLGMVWGHAREIIRFILDLCGVDAPRGSLVLFGLA